ncbi:putative LOC107392956-like protein [Nothobranchius furzeri]|uniref:LOC107392956-like protein n=1 Tax=Nothobranchius furzeri TaxID=105023 RepID=A0A9D2XJG4_NOTFU|nr:putative LOC107392956-like protein [Nothobranchius furzeri]
MLAPNHSHKMIRAWQNTNSCLDIWHFMRTAVGCATDSHPLYAGFLNKLSHCIFMWDDRDSKALKEAKRAELEAKLVHPTDLLRNISRAEMARHCKRTTRSSSEMETLISELIEAYSGHRGCNSLGVPLINLERMAEIWKAQKKHLSCLQDPPGVLLYMETGTIKEGGHVLETYRRARGSTSLECFHLHMNRFIPGTLASDIFLQAYLLDGLARWNEDRSMSAEGRSEPPVPQEPPSRLASP